MIVIKNLYKKYTNSDPKNIFDNFSLKINKGDFIAIFGPNGVGKTTLLRIVAGLENFQSGNITINGKSFQKIRIGYIPQNYTKTLLPWYPVSKNITLPLVLAGWHGAKAQKTLKTIAEEFSISLPWEKYPYNLSGGQQQMAVILRSVINHPDLLLMDEPFSSLDVKTSMEIQNKVLEITQKRKLITLFVSHRIEEGIFLSNRILVLNGKPASVFKDIKNPLIYPRTQAIRQPNLINSLTKEVSNGIML